MDIKKRNGKEMERNGKKRKGKKRKRICKHTQKGGVAYPYYQLFKRLRDQTVFLLSTEAGQILLDEVHDVSVVADNVGLSHANINVGALGEQFCRTCGILEDEE